MVLESEIIPFWTWIVQNTSAVLIAVFVLIALSIFFGFLAGSFRNGPIESVRMTCRTVFGGIAELFQLSPRRVFAVAKLSFRESMRRRVYVVFIVFVILLMFGSWFLDRNSDHPARLLMGFVLTSTSFLVILLSIFLSCFSIPADVKNKTIYTIVTKPVRGWEVVLGRMLGFCGIGTALLAVMCLASLIFVIREVDHTHTVDADQMQVSESEGAEAVPARSSLTNNHRHDVSINQVDGENQVFVSPARDHRHEATVDESGQASLGATIDSLQAKVPLIGKLRFLDRTGRAGDGVNVGYEWKYRKYIEGGSLATAIWRFKGVTEENFPDGYLPIEMTLRVFRTYKGLIESGIGGQLQIVRPAPLDESGKPMAIDGGMRSVPLSFTAKDFEILERRIPRTLSGFKTDGTEFEADLFRDLATVDGDLEIWVRCLDAEQYFGMAPADLYLRASDKPFWINFIKGYCSIWFQMVVVTCFGVMFSTFLNGAVGMLATLSSMIIGYNKATIFGVSSGEIPGGGPLESLVRLVLQMNQMIELDPTWTTWIIKSIDKVLLHVIDAVTYAMPNCGEFNTSRFVAYGYDVPSDLVSQHFVITMLYFLILTGAAYFFFKTREIAA